MVTAHTFERVGYQNYGQVYELFQRNANDPAIYSEFEQSFQQFATPHMVKNRILEAYDCLAPDRIGKLVCEETGLEPVGFGWIGITQENIDGYRIQWGKFVAVY